jgi:hypothetical protein
MFYCNAEQNKTTPENVQLMAEHALCCSGNHSTGYHSPLVCTPGNYKQKQIVSSWTRYNHKDKTGLGCNIEIQHTSLCVCVCCGD